MGQRDPDRGPPEVNPMSTLTLLLALFAVAWTLSDLILAAFAPRRGDRR